MKKLLLLSLAAVLLLASCAKEGKVKSSHRLSKVYEERTVLCDGQFYYTLSSDKVQEWHWDGNELYRIDYSEDEGMYSENIFYDRRGRIVRTTVPAYGRETQVSYDGKYLDSIKVWCHDQLELTYAFTHTSGKISEIVISQYSNEAKPCRQAVLNLVLGGLIPDDCLNQLASMKGQGSTVVCKVEWDHQNVSRMTVGDATYSYTYTEGMNPYRQCYTFFEINGVDGNLQVLSKNAVKTMRTLFDGNPNYTFVYDYTFTDNYPTQSVLTYSYHAMNNLTLGTSEYQVTNKRRFEYLD